MSATHDARDDRRIENLEKEIEKLRGLLTSVILSVRFRDDAPFEALLAQLEIAGDKRTALNLVLTSVLARAKRNPPQQVRDRELLDRFPVIEQAQIAGDIDLADAIRLLAGVVGSQATAYEVLRAHKNSGFGTDAYERLGLGDVPSDPQQNESRFG